MTQSLLLLDWLDGGSVGFGSLKSFPMLTFNLSFFCCYFDFFYLHFVWSGRIWLRTELFSCFCFKSIIYCWHRRRRYTRFVKLWTKNNGPKCSNCLKCVHDELCISDFGFCVVYLFYFLRFCARRVTYYCFFVSCLNLSLFFFWLFLPSLTVLDENNSYMASTRCVFSSFLANSLIRNSSMHHFL